MTNGTIYIVDDNAETAQSLAFFLESLGWRTRVWNDPETFLIDYEELAADGCFIFDIRMPKIDGLELLERLNAKGNKRPIIILTGHGDVNMVVKAFKNGAFDFFLKPPAEKELIEAVEKALTVSSDVKFQAEKLAYDRKRFDSLTDREKDVVILVGKGMMNKTIADTLKISEKTVQQHRGVACKKLNLINAVEIADFLRNLNLR